MSKRRLQAIIRELRTWADKQRQDKSSAGRNYAGGIDFAIAALEMGIDAEKKTPMTRAAKEG